MNPSELAQVVAYMARLWPNFSADDETLNVWREWVGDDEFSHVLAVVRTHGADTFPPGPGQVAKELVHLRSGAPSPDEAFDEVLRARDYDAYRTSRRMIYEPEPTEGGGPPEWHWETVERPEWQWSHPAVQAASSVVDRLPVYADFTSDGLNWNRRRFMKAYTAILDRQEIYAALPAGSRDTLAELERGREPVLETALDVADGWEMPALEEVYE
ncbi:MAG: hypothetical protein ACLP36_02795 [Acidimicrobiales bacterium]